MRRGDAPTARAGWPTCCAVRSRRAPGRLLPAGAPAGRATSASRATRCVPRSTCSAPRAWSTGSRAPARCHRAACCPTASTAAGPRRDPSGPRAGAQRGTPGPDWCRPLGARGDAAGARHRERRPLPRAAPARRRRAGLARPDLRGPRPRRAAARLRPGRDATSSPCSSSSAGRALGDAELAIEAACRRPLGRRAARGRRRARRCCCSSGSPSSTTVVPVDLEYLRLPRRPDHLPRHRPTGCRPTSPEHEETP